MPGSGNLRDPDNDDFMPPGAVSPHQVIVVIEMITVSHPAGRYVHVVMHRSRKLYDRAQVEGGVSAGMMYKYEPYMQYNHSERVIATSDNIGSAYCPLLTKFALKQEQ